MKRLRAILSLMVIMSSTQIYSQVDGYKVNGQVIDRQTREGIPYAAVVIIGIQDSGTIADSLGFFSFEKVKPGIKQFSAIQLGYRTTVTPEYEISPYTVEITIEMDEDPTELSASTVKPSPFLRSVESPVSVKLISIADIENIPGANKDIARIVRSYPGVSFSPIGYRNDLIVRGGGPSENTFFIDGIEIPNINHFATQGATGGPVSILNSDLIREIKFYTGSFPANRGGALSSVMDITLKDGNLEKQVFKATIGASEAGMSSSGHIGKNTTFIASARQSYLQLLFKLLGLPLLPNYIDAQFKTKTRINDRNEVILLGLAGFDNMSLNMNAEDAADRYLLSYLPELKQETFTIGGSWKHYIGKHTQSLSIGYNYLNNRSIKYLNNDDSSSKNIILKSSGMEGKVSARFENKSYYGLWTLKEGIECYWRHYESNIFKMQRSGLPDDYDSRINFFSGALYTSAEYRSSDNKLNASIGLRTDGSTLSYESLKIWEQISPRASISFMPIEPFSLNASIGAYHQLPPVTALSYIDNMGISTNRDLPYMHIISGAVGLEWRLRERLQISLEGFWKQYFDIPVSVATGIPLTCLGADYGSIGEEVLIPTGRGRAYGTELMGRWTIPDKLNMICSFTLYRSEFKNGKDDSYIPSSWDNRFIINLSCIYDLPRNWSLGAKVSGIGGAPYTPYDMTESSRRIVWDASGKPVYDYSWYNKERLDPYVQLDIRTDKAFYFDKWSLSLYIDLENITFSKIRQPDAVLSSGKIIDRTVSREKQEYEMEMLELWSGTLVPAVGVCFEF